MVLTSTIQPMATRPRKGMNRDTVMRKRRAFLGVPSRFRAPNQRGRMPRSAMAYIRRLAAV